MNTNCDANNESALILSNMFAGITIAKTSASDGTITLTITDGDTVTIRHETRTYDIFGETRTKKTGTGGGLTLRARDAIENGQTITAAWVEKTETYREPSDYDDEEETIETISLYAMFDGDLRPTLLTNNTTRYSWKAEHPDFTIKRGSVSVTADSARISSSFHRPWKERTNPRSVGKSLRAKSETRQHGMSAPANIHGQGRSPIRTQEATKHHTGPSQPHHTPHHTPARRTVRPTDGQTRAKRTPGRVIARKRVRSPYGEL